MACLWINEDIKSSEFGLRQEVVKKKKISVEQVLLKDMTNSEGGTTFKSIFLCLTREC